MTLNEAELLAIKTTGKEVKQFYKIIADEYLTAQKAIIEELKTLYLETLSGIAPEDYYNVVLKTSRLENLILKLQDEYLKASIKAGTLTEEAARLTMSNNFYRQRFGLSFAANTKLPVQLSFVVLPAEAIEISVVGTPKVWAEIAQRKIDSLEKKWGPLKNYQARHGTLTDTLLKNRQGDLLKIRREITQGLMQGKSYKQTASRIKGLLQTSKKHAFTVVRTETHRALSAGSYANVMNAREEFGVEVRRQIIATLSDNTRAQSASVDTKFENENGVFIYPGGVEVYFPGNSGVAKWDINDREVTINRLEGFPIDERRGRNPLTGDNEIINFQDFDTWAKTNGLKKNKYGEFYPG